MEVVMDKDIMVQNIKYLCSKNEVTISQLEREIGVSPGFLTRMSSSYPSIDKVAAVADFFNVSIDFICNFIIKEDSLYDIFVENLAIKTQKRTIQWRSVDYKERKYTILEKYNIDDDHLGSDWTIYVTVDNETEIVCARQYVYHADDETLEYKNCFYLVIYVNYTCNRIQVDEKLVGRLFENINTVLYKDPLKEKVDNIIKNFIKKS